MFTIDRSSSTRCTLAGSGPRGHTVALCDAGAYVRSRATVRTTFDNRDARTMPRAADTGATLAGPTSDQRVGHLGPPKRGPRCAQRDGAPQGTRNFGERSGREVYGATPSSAAKETTTLPKVHWGGGRSRGRRSPSGESPKASRGATTKSVHPSISVEGGKA